MVPFVHIITKNSSSSSNRSIIIKYICTLISKQTLLEAVSYKIKTINKKPEATPIADPIKVISIEVKEKNFKIKYKMKSTPGSSLSSS